MDIAFIRAVYFGKLIWLYILMMLRMLRNVLSDVLINVWVW
jgi:hypothetical protein